MGPFPSPAGAASCIARPRSRKSFAALATGNTPAAAKAEYSPSECPAKKAGVMGYPVGHSRSPALHGFWLERHGIDGAYVPMAVRPGDLAAALRALPILGFAGCNLTIPHKEAALALVDRVDPLARRIGAVNTVVAAADGESGLSSSNCLRQSNCSDAQPNRRPQSR